jgi:hypothetical protein
VEQTITVELQNCHICSTQLIPHPLYEKSGAVYCPDDGDYFILRSRGKAPKIVFRPFVEDVFVAPMRNTRPQKIASLEPLRYVVPKLDPSTARLTQQKDSVGLRIRCDQTGVIFTSLKEAGIAMFLTKSRLSAHINGKVSHVKGYSFTILGDQGDMPFVQKPRIEYKGGLSTQKKVRCEQTGQIFDSARCAARDMKLNRNNMWEHMKSRWRRHHVGGYSFVYVDEEG